MTRITGGRLRGRSIQIPKLPASAHLRPTLSKVRSAIFNSIQGHVDGARVLDIFSGCGSLGFEALSRDALSVAFVEGSPVALKVIRENAQTLKVDEQCRFLRFSLEKERPQDLLDLKRLAGVEAFDLVLIDPPYRRDWESWMVGAEAWGELLTLGGILVIEWLPHTVEDLPEETPFLVKVRQKNYGDSVVTTYKRK